MKYLLFAMMIPLVLFACKNEDPAPEPDIAPIVHKWKLTAYENTVNGENIWVPIDSEPIYISFRFDGLILDSNGLPSCCAPKAYYVNGAFFEVKPKAAVPLNPHCSMVFCMSCTTLNIEQIGDELILSGCDSSMSRSKYVRK
jgi:hypothetical protein